MSSSTLSYLKARLEKPGEWLLSLPTLHLVPDCGHGQPAPREVEDDGEMAQTDARPGHTHLQRALTLPYGPQLRLPQQPLPQLHYHRQQRTEGAQAVVVQSVRPVSPSQVTGLGCRHSHTPTLPSSTHSPILAFSLPNFFLVQSEFPSCSEGSPVLSVFLQYLVCSPSNT